MRIAICDDEKYFIDMLELPVRSFFSERRTEIEMFTFTSGTDLLNGEFTYDLIFLDISMPDMSGMEVASKIREKDKNVIIIFVTSESHRVFDSFKVKAFDFIVKPINLLELNKALERVCTEVNQGNEGLIVDLMTGGQAKINLKDILFIESANRNIIIHSRSSNLEVVSKMKDIEEKLPSELFFKTHKSFIINLSHVKKYDKTSVWMEDNSEVILSRLKYQEFKNAFLNSFGN